MENQVQKPISRTYHSTKVKKKFHFRWWMAVILVVIIAVVGIAVLRFSRASVIPPDELDAIQMGIMISNPGINGVTVSYKPYNYTRQFSLPEAIRAQQDPAEYQKLMDLVIADLEQIYIKNHPTATQTTPATTPAANTSTPSGDVTVQNTAQPSSDATTTPADTTNSISNSATGATTTTNSTPKDLGTVSGFQTFQFTPSGNAAIKSVALVINNVMVGVDKSAPYTFDVDTSQFTNGTYPLKTIVTNADDSTVQTNYTITIQNSSVNLFVYSLGTPWRFVFSRR